MNSKDSKLILKIQNELERFKINSKDSKWTLKIQNEPGLVSRRQVLMSISDLPTAKMSTKLRKMMTF
jgi:hypothetical protein